MGIELEQDERIPFYSQGSTIFFNLRYPSDDELESYPHVVLTYDKPERLYGTVGRAGAKRGRGPGFEAALVALKCSCTTWFQVSSQRADLCSIALTCSLPVYAGPGSHRW